MSLKFNYEGEETPVERLRNKLQPLFFIVEQLKKGESLDDFTELIDGAYDNLDDIRDHLSDARPFYEQRGINKYLQQMREMKKEAPEEIKQYPPCPDDAFTIGDMDLEEDKK